MIGASGAKLDRFSELLLDAEEALYRSNMLITASVPMGPDHLLRWAKSGDEWMFFYVVASNLDQETQHPLHKASIRMRCLAANHLADLRRAIDVALLERDQEIDRAIAAVEAFLAGLPLPSELPSTNESKGDDP